MSRRGNSGRDGNRGQVSGRGSGPGRGDGFGSRRGGGRGSGRCRGKNQVTGQGVSRRTDVETHSRQEEQTQYLQDTRDSIPREFTPTEAENEIKMLMSQADTIRVQLQTIYTRISVLQSGKGDDPIEIIDGNLLRKTSKTKEVGGAVAVINQDECINCGICANFCP